MAISEHDRQVLQDLENDLLAKHHGSSPASGRGRFAGLLGATAGLALGLVLLFIGLRLDSTLGTCVGVVGALMFIVNAWLGVNSTSQWLGSRARVGKALPKQE